MSFLDSFSMFFQEISLVAKSYTKGIYGEDIKNGNTEQNFRGVIQRNKDFQEVFLLENKNIKITSKDFELRCNIDVSPKKGDLIKSSDNEYEVIYTEKVIIEGKHDHNVCIIRLNE